MAVGIAYRRGVCVFLNNQATAGLAAVASTLA